MDQLLSILLNEATCLEGECEHTFPGQNMQGACQIFRCEQFN